MRKEIDQKLQKQQEEYEAGLKTGKEHLIEIDVDDESIAKILDCPAFSNFHYHGPFRYLVELGIISEHDAKVLYTKGYLKLLKGKESSLWDYAFQEFNPDELINPDHLRCTECGMYLDYNMIGFNEKMGIHREEHYRCPDCLGASREYVAEVAQHYKSLGCTMFI
jgi:hypothetical protein